MEDYKDYILKGIKKTDNTLRLGICITSALIIGVNAPLTYLPLCFLIFLFEYFSILYLVGRFYKE